MLLTVSLVGRSGLVQLIAMQGIHAILSKTMIMNEVLKKKKKSTHILFVKRWQGIARQIKA